MNRSKSRPFLGAGAFIFAVALTACGGSAADTVDADTATPDTATPDTATADTGAEATETPDDAFAECLRENGVDIPEGQLQPGAGARPGQAPNGTMPTGPPDEVIGIDGEAFAAAREACADLLPEGAVMFGGPGGPAGAGIDESAFRAYRSCMADHGIELPEAGAGPAGAEGAAPPEVSIARDDPEFAAAQETCSALLPEMTESAPPTTAA